MVSGAPDVLGPICGTPRRLSGVLPAGTVPPGEASLRLVTVEGKPHVEPVAVGIETIGNAGQMLLRVRLDRSTPPGRHRAELLVGDETRQVILDVEPSTLLRVEPPSLSLHGAPGATLTASLLIVNRGNVDVAIPAYAIVGVYSEEGIETAVARAYGADADDGLEILKTFIMELRAGYGGLLKLDIEEGVGPILPGGAQNLRLRTTLPAKLMARRAYSGFWAIENLRYLISVSVTKGDSNVR